MKVHKQSVLIEANIGYLEVVSFYETELKTYGADIYYEEKLTESITAMNNEPLREHLLAIGYHFILTHEKKQVG